MRDKRWLATAFFMMISCQHVYAQDRNIPKLMGLEEGSVKHQSNGTYFVKAGEMGMLSSDLLASDEFIHIVDGNISKEGYGKIGFREMRSDDPAVVGHLMGMPFRYDCLGEEAQMVISDLVMFAGRDALPEGADLETIVMPRAHISITKGEDCFGVARIDADKLFVMAADASTADISGFKMVMTKDVKGLELGETLISAPSGSEVMTVSGLTAFINGEIRSGKISAEVVNMRFVPDDTLFPDLTERLVLKDPDEEMSISLKINADLSEGMNADISLTADRLLSLSADISIEAEDIISQPMNSRFVSAHAAYQDAGFRDSFENFTGRPFHEYVGEALNDNVPDKFSFISEAVSGWLDGEEQSFSAEPETPVMFAMIAASALFGPAKMVDTLNIKAGP